MELYILRHADAMPQGSAGYSESDRPLTPEGIAAMKEAAKGISKLVGSFDVVLTSPLKRARQTAEIVADAFGCLHKIEACPYLSPGALPRELASALSGHAGKDRILLVGHEPDLGSIASSLIGARKSVIEFKKGSLCRIDVPAPAAGGYGVLIWHMQLKQLRMLASIGKAA